eukprot:5177744-Prymnesium_polylepis.1
MGTAAVPTACAIVSRWLWCMLSHLHVTFAAQRVGELEHLPNDDRGLSLLESHQRAVRHHCGQRRVERRRRRWHTLVYDAALELRQVDARHLKHLPARLVDLECWHRAYASELCELLRLVHVHLAESGAGRKALSQGGELRRDELARSAPHGVEVDHHQSWRNLHHDILQIFDARQAPHGERTMGLTRAWCVAELKTCPTIPTVITH